MPESFGAALRDTAVAALSDRGWEVRLVDLYAEGFDPVLSADERRQMDRAPTDPKLAPHIENLKWAQAILFVYPTWWYGLPAMLKGWLDRVWATDVAFTLPADGGRIVSLVPHIGRVGVVTTCGAPWWWSVMIGQPGRKTILRGLRALCAPTLPHVLPRALRHGPLDGGEPCGISGEGEAQAGEVLAGDLSILDEFG